MRRLSCMTALLFLGAGALPAQGRFAYELGVYGLYAKYDDLTNIKDGFGAGARFGIYPLKNFALEYEGELATAKSKIYGELFPLTNRINGVLYFPLTEKLRFLAGGGFTGMQYSKDTTGNTYDSGGNAVVGFKYCMNTDWSWRADVAADFKSGGDQTQSANRTTQYNVRLGLSRFLGGNNKNATCYQAPPPPPPPPAPAPAPQPAPPPPAVVEPAPPPAPAPAPPAPAPAKARELFTLHGVHFAYDKAVLTKVAKDTLLTAVSYLKEHGDVKVEVQGHTDAKGSDDYNMKLGERRAEAVKTYLESQGVAASRISTKSFGKTVPVAENTINGRDNPKGRAENRRVVIIELP